MTSREIALATGKTERSVRNWIASLAEKSSVIAEKSSVSSPMKPADYTLEETCMIIEKGLGKNAASLFRENAMRAKSLEVKSESSRIDRLESMVEKLVLAIATIPQQIAQSQSSQPIQDYYSIMGYANKKGMQIMFSDALRLGKEAAKLSNEKGIEIRKVPDERFGNVNSYHVDILVKVFEV